MLYDIVSPWVSNQQGMFVGMICQIALCFTGDKWGYDDKTGNVTIIEPEYENVGIFHNGMANVMQNGKWGYIDKTGKRIIEPQFDWSNEFRGELAKVWIGGMVGYIDKTGNYIWEPTK